MNEPSNVGTTGRRLEVTRGEGRAWGNSGLGTGGEINRDRAGEIASEERFHPAKPCGMVKEDTGAKAEEKVGLLRSVPQDHPGCQ